MWIIYVYDLINSNIIYKISKYENVYRYAVRGGKIEKRREKQRERETKRERDRERDKERERKI